MIRKIAVLLLLLLLTGLLGGCWNRREITEIAIVLGAGVDWTKDGKIRLTVQIARPGAFYGGGEGGAGGREPASWVVSAEGKTVAEAERNLARKVPRDIYWGHCIVLVFGEELAKKGMRLAMSFFNRDRQPRENMWVMVAKGEAKDILETYSALEKTSAQTVGFLTRIKTGYAVRNYELSQMWASRGVQPAVSAVEVKDAGVTPGMGQEKKSPPYKQVEFSGAAVLKRDKLIGWLGPYETKGLLWLKGEPVKGVIVVPSPGEPDKKVSIRIRRGSTKIEPKRDGEYPVFDVKIRVEGDLIEQQSDENLAKPGKIKTLEKEMAQDILRITTAVLEKAQLDYGVDIFGFGEAFHRKYKKEWKKFRDRWDDEVFTRAEVNIAVEAHIREIGLFTKRLGARVGEE